MPGSTPVPEYSLLLAAAVAGDPAALDRLLPLVYDELRVRVRRLAAAHPADPIPAAQVAQDAYMTRFRSAALETEQRPHYLAFAALALRQLLTEHARAGDDNPLLLGDGAHPLTLSPALLLDLDAALALLPPRRQHVAQCRLFAGMDVRETAAALGISERTVRRDWSAARPALLVLEHLSSTEPNLPAG